MFERDGSPVPGWSRDTYRAVRPAQPVWVSLGAALNQPTSGRPPVPEGLDLASEVPGELVAWERTTTGEWAGLVTFVVRRAHARAGGTRHTMWLYGRALRRREDVGRRR
ncbi:hypothetical protein [Actinoalloteichus caeruleus]|uniref:Uncharacterized protein n=2 Tax=Actinoalloteichus TaxID=65496 RepID=A0ABT1JP71_ACTCY|nr:hypothetical protein [Actinoalloteichus caeruleus]MCP2333931.1 hypothetical protein [Actinoalloteichus caeruleus DSM 43889]